MRQTNYFMADLLDLDSPEAAQDVLWRAGRPTSVEDQGDMVCIFLPFQVQNPGKDMVADPTRSARTHRLWVRAYGGAVVRLTLDLVHGSVPADARNVMLQQDSTLQPDALHSTATATGWDILDPSGHVRLRLNTSPASTHHWSDLIEAPAETLDLTIYPDGTTEVPFKAYDSFFPKQQESLPLAYVEHQQRPSRVAFSLAATPGEKFAGSGERFASMNLSGRTLELENTDALGVNNRRAYKNVPFYVSSRPYGLLVLTSAHVRLSLADLSTRSAQGMVDDSLLDLFIIGGGNPERIVYNYRRLTGFPQDVPLWSYGIWMSRMTYVSANQTRQVADRLRKEQFPCDVIHVDTGWFRKDWACDWKFSPLTFPEPEKYLAEMRSLGFRISLWQLPSVSKDTDIYENALAKHYIAQGSLRGDPIISRSNFGESAQPGTIDFTNPAAVAWYQGMLHDLLAMGVAVIKTDFGELIDMYAEYRGMPPRLLHNLYCLFYQKAAHEITRKTRGEGIIWARAGWIGCQRYPVHWGGDAACSWDGLAGTLRGGLHLGVSGFAFWSHDVPGFHGVPDFMNSYPPDDLYVRWTQFGVFTSHMRYHGAQPREPYEYPAVADLVRKWWRLRYALIPYLAESGRQSLQSGFPVLRALLFHHSADPVCWTIDDEYYLGESFLVAPLLNSAGKRDIYLPEGKWRDLWTGKAIQGPVWLKDVLSPLERMPVFVVDGARVPVYPQVVQSTNEMDLSKVVQIAFDDSYTGLAGSVLGQVTGLGG